MASSARISDRATVQVKYWTANDEGQHLIGKWLEEHLEGVAPTWDFYGSFINYCIQQVNRVRRPATKWARNQDKERASELWAVLKQDPLDVREFIGALEKYLTSAGGFKRLDKPAAEEDTHAIMRGDKQLREAVWTKDERLRAMINKGEKASTEKSQRRMGEIKHEDRVAARSERKRRMAALQAEREREREEAAEQWKELREATDDVER